MITRALREASKREEGQALVLACLMILVISIAVISTVNLGHSIYERQRLQNTADSAAYSMAALEARAFNFYAFVNRTHVSHYVTAMVWQSILSFIYFVEAMIVDVLGVMVTLDCDGQRGVVKGVCEVIKDFVPVVGTIQRFINSTLVAYKQLVRAVLSYLRTADPDAAIGRRIIPTYYVMNGLLTGSAEATLEATLQQVQSTSADVVHANDRNVDVTSSRFAMGLLSACMLSRTHMRESWHTENSGVPWGRAHFSALDPTTTRDIDKISRAKRSMGAVSNATRFALDRNNNGSGDLAGPGWTTSRKLADLVDFPANFRDLHDLIVKYVDDPDAPGDLHLGKWGQTKMLTHVPVPGLSNTIRNWEDPLDAPFGAMAQGDDLGSDDLYRINIGEWNARWSDPIVGAGINNKHFLACRPEDPPLECWGDARYDSRDPKNLTTKKMLKTSIWATQSRPLALHYRLVSVPNGRVYPNAPGAELPLRYKAEEELSRFGLSDVEIDVTAGWGAWGVGVTLHKYVANVRPVADGNHPWHGVAPFPHFEPGQYARACRNDPYATGPVSGSTPSLRLNEFNQPSTFALLTKNADQLQNRTDRTGAGTARPALLNSQGALNFAFSRAARPLVLDDTRMTFMNGKGLHAMSRAQAYYHRPGNWHEQPNFFNPYWRPRLAAVLQGNYANPLVDSFVRQLPEPLLSMPQKAITH